MGKLGALALALGVGLFTSSVQAGETPPALTKAAMVESVPFVKTQGEAGAAGAAGAGKPGLPGAEEAPLFFIAATRSRRRRLGLNKRERALVKQLRRAKVMKNPENWVKHLTEAQKEAALALGESPAESTKSNLLVEILKQRKCVDFLMGLSEEELKALSQLAKTSPPRYWNGEGVRLLPFDSSSYFKT